MGQLYRPYFINQSYFMNAIFKSMLTPLFIKGVFLLLFIVSLSNNSNAETYKENKVFVSEIFSQNPPSPQYVWLTGALEKQVNTILKHPYGKLRIKYWILGDKSAWILEEIGKVELITTGIIIDTGKISKMEILAFHESRGWEVKYPFFLKQFINATLKDNTQLNQNVDGITGATLSVRAVTKLARVALLLHNHVIDKQ